MKTWNQWLQQRQTHPTLVHASFNYGLAPTPTASRHNPEQSVIPLPLTPPSPLLCTCPWIWPIHCHTINYLDHLPPLSPSLPPYLSSHLGSSLPRFLFLLSFSFSSLLFSLNIFIATRIDNLNQSLFSFLLFSFLLSSTLPFFFSSLIHLLSSLLSSLSPDLEVGRK